MKRQESNQARQVAGMGILFALAITLSFLEGLMPPFLPNGVRLGLSNVVTMYAVFLLGSVPALILVVLKSLFVLLTRGYVSGLLSIAGGLLSVTLLCGILYCMGTRLRYMPASMLGAVAHNMGQLAAAAYILKLSSIFWYYLPVLVVAGIIMGFLTSLVLRAVMPLLVTMTIRRPQ